MHRRLIFAACLLLVTSASADEWKYEGGGVPIAYSDTASAQFQFACRGGDLAMGFWVREPHSQVAGASSMSVAITADPEPQSSVTVFRRANIGRRQGVNVPGRLTQRPEHRRHNASGEYQGDGPWLEVPFCHFRGREPIELGKPLIGASQEGAQAQEGQRRGEHARRREATKGAKAGSGDKPDPAAYSGHPHRGRDSRYRRSQEHSSDGNGGPFRRGSKDAAGKPAYGHYQR
ncbi:hypothetical protein [Devosia sp. RR2S18]|uniref:hypothetical protein n=1 Tax=Devosia rhizosphaerae TaxID=3049774 RepID=UPI002540B6F2|nr:hypothetical protein [Devosia sp. RR2S18]WIJ26927.1 hypothetical protein QOV41_09335 [Devosia sp. RR2S18]